MTIGDELKRSILKMQVYRDEHKERYIHQKVLMDICQMLDPLCDGILDVNFTEVFLFGREITEDERSKLKELWYANKTRE